MLYSYEVSFVGAVRHISVDHFLRPLTHALETGSRNRHNRLNSTPVYSNTNGTRTAFEGQKAVNDVRSQANCPTETNERPQALQISTRCTITSDVWSAMLEKYHKLQPKPKTTDELKVVLQTIWEELPQEHKSASSSHHQQTVSFQSHQQTTAEDNA